MQHTYIKILSTFLILPLCLLLFASQAHADLLKYSKDGDFAKIQEAVEQGADVNTKTKIEVTPLMFACLHGNIDIVRYLIEQGADIQAKDNNDRTALMFVCETGHLDIVKYLVEQGADMRVKNKYDRTPLMTASMRGRLGVVKYLVEQGADLHIKNRNGTALDYAHINKRQGVVDYLQSKQ